VFTDIGEKTLHLHSEIINNIKTLKSNYRNCLRRNGRHTGFCVNCRINAMGNQRSICATIGIQLKHLFPAWVSKNIAISAELIIKKNTLLSLVLLVHENAAQNYLSCFSRANAAKHYLSLLPRANAQNITSPSSRAQMPHKSTCPLSHAQKAAQNYRFPLLLTRGNTAKHYLPPISHAQRPQNITCPSSHAQKAAQNYRSPPSSHAQMPQNALYPVLLSRANAAKHTLPVLLSRANAAKHTLYLSFSASSPGKRKGGLMTQVTPPNMKRMAMNSVKPQASFKNSLADRLGGGGPLEIQAI
jgi:hypothetical protein